MQDSPKSYHARPSAPSRLVACSGMAPNTCLGTVKLQDGFPPSLKPVKLVEEGAAPSRPPVRQYRIRLARAACLLAAAWLSIAVAVQLRGASSSSSARSDPEPVGRTFLTTDLAATVAFLEGHLGARPLAAHARAPTVFNSSVVVVLDASSFGQVLTLVADPRVPAALAGAQPQAAVANMAAQMALVAARAQYYTQWEDHHDGYTVESAEQVAAIALTAQLPIGAASHQPRAHQPRAPMGWLPSSDSSAVRASRCRGVASMLPDVRHRHRAARGWRRLSWQPSGIATRFPMPTPRAAPVRTKARSRRVATLGFG